MNGYHARNFVTFDGTTQFVALSAAALGGKTHYQYYLNGNGWNSQVDPNHTFIGVTITFTGGPNAGDQLYYPQQVASFIPFPSSTAPFKTAPALLDQTNAQLMAKYGLSVGDQVAPTNATALALSNGFIGAAAPVETANLYSRDYTNQTSYQLQYLINGNQRIIESTNTTLTSGWNFLTRTIGGLLNTFMVWADVNPSVPAFTPAAANPLSMPLALLPNGYTLNGTFLDPAQGPVGFTQVFTGAQLQALPVMTRPDGNEYVVLPGVNFKDAAGTTFSNIPIQLTLTLPYSPLGAFNSALDIGSPALGGSASFDPNSGTYTVTGAGTDINSASDQFQFVSTSMTGDNTLTARVTSVANTDPSAKAGLMFRNDSSASAMFADVVVTPGQSVSFQTRSMTGGLVSVTTFTGYAIPIWLKLIRNGNSFMGYYSTVTNPVAGNWIQIGTSKTIPMSGTVQAGLAVTSHNTSTAATATFTNVQFASQQVDLSSAFNNGGIASDGSLFNNGQSLDSGGSSFSATLLKNSVSWHGSAFNIGAADTNDTVMTTGQTIIIPTGTFSSLQFLATATRGSQANQTFTINYTDGTTQTYTQGISDWASSSTYAGESVAVSMPYRNGGGGTSQAGNFKLYGYTIALNPTKIVESITLPNNGNVKLLAMNLLA